MEAKKTIFSTAQFHILEMMRYFKTDSAVLEFQEVIASHYARKVQEEADRLWNEGVLDAEAIEKLDQEHLRTPYVHS